MSHHHHAKAEIAIITPNLLMGLGLSAILERVIPMAEIERFRTMEEFLETESDRFSHFFVSYSIYCAHSEFFLKSGYRTILLLENALQQPPASLFALQVNQSEEHLVHDLLMLRNGSRVTSHSLSPHPEQGVSGSSQLTEREREVLVQVARGQMNKEIAHTLNISITTVISHRKNLVNKLGIRSVAGLTIHAINQGYVDVASLMK